MKTYKDAADLTFNQDEYNYQPTLTEKLDSTSNQEFNQELLNEIVLWKINRYATLTHETFNRINQIPVDVKELDEPMTRNILSHLLSNTSRGIGLALASTILRFRNPNVYQIIDQRAYRYAMGKLLKVYKSTPVEKQIDIYIEYLKKLKEIADEKQCDFSMLDRVLYYLDKEHNKEDTIKT